MRVEPYLYFQGRCEEALDFYREAIGADGQVVARFDGQAPGQAGEVAHAVIRIGDTNILASDGRGGGQATFGGFSLSLTAADDTEAERLFASLAEGGNVKLPMTSTPFASRLGLVDDRFGVPWMITTVAGQ
jgi:PhnB protein